MSLLISLLGVSPILTMSGALLKKVVDSAIQEEDLNGILYDLVYNQENYEEAMDICEDYLDSEDSFERALAYSYRAVCQLYKAELVKTHWRDYPEEEYTSEGFKETIDEAISEKEEFLKHALSDIDASLRIFEENEILEWYEFAALDKGNILSSMCRLDEARRWYIFAMNSSNEGVRNSAKSNYETITERLLNLTNQYLSKEQEKEEMRDFLKSEGESEESIQEFLNDMEINMTNSKFENKYPLGDRQFLFIVKNTDKIAGCYDPDGIINWVFTLNQIPASIVFPIGHPQANTLYVAHPAQPGAYLPFDGAEDKIFQEKIDDFCHLAQCLGATEISFRSIKGESISESLSNRLNIGGSVGVKGHSINSEYTHNKFGSSDAEYNKEVGYSYSLQPKQAYVPSDLRWLEIDKSWQNFVKQRMNGNVLSYTKRISSSEAINMSNSMQMSVKASFENLMANVNGSYSADDDSTFSHNQSSEWEIRIQFASLDELNHQSETAIIQQTVSVHRQDILTDSEMRYKEEVLFILEDGEITETERHFLERKRIKYGLTEDQAAKVEAMCIPTLTDSEKEYLEIFKDIVGDGLMTDRKRRMLNREAESLGISAERMCELELSINNQ